MINLTTAMNPGDLDGFHYTHVKVTQFRWDQVESRISLRCQAGYIDSGKFHPGHAVGAADCRFVIQDTADSTDYTDLMASATSGGGVCAEFMGAVYQYLIDQNHYQGTVEV